ncbi:MAG TPA: ABC transporter ATP-binding protein [Rhodothermales bacterium]
MERPESRAARVPARRIAGAIDDLFRVHRGALIGLVVLGLVASLVEGIGISLFIPLLHSLSPDSVLAGDSDYAQFLVRWADRLAPAQRLPVLVLAIVSVVLLKTVLTLGYAALNGHVTYREGHRLRVRLFERIQHGDFGYLEQMPQGRLLDGLTTEMWRATDALSGLFSLYIAVCTSAVYLILLVFLSWELTLIVGIGMLVISLIARRVAHRVDDIGVEATVANGILSQRISDGLDGIKQIRIFGRESYEIRRFKQSSAVVSSSFWKLGVLAEVVSPIFEVLSAVLIGALLLVQFGSTLELPALLVFLFVLYRLKPRVEELDRTRIRLAGLYPAVEELRDLINIPAAPTSSEGAPLAHIRQNVQFRNVSFRYPNQERNALTDVSFTVPVGRTTAIVGPSGSGKSTILRLLIRLHDPDEGRILVGATPLTDLDLASWRSNLGVVSQDAYLFDATIAENILYGREGAMLRDAEEAARRAHAHNFIMSLPDGYRTRVQERGIRLSGGQQQRIVLARALIRNPEMLVLDEATNSLDALSERLVHDALEEFSGGRTVVVVAHRMSSIERADHIVVLNEGRVVDEGPFEELSIGTGLFAELYRVHGTPAPAPSRS